MLLCLMDSGLGQEALAQTLPRSQNWMLSGQGQNIPMQGERGHEAPSLPSPDLFSKKNKDTNVSCKPEKGSKVKNLNGQKSYISSHDHAADYLLVLRPSEKELAPLWLL